MLDVVAKLHPFRDRKVVEQIPPGMTIADILDHLAKKHNVNGWYTKNVYVELGGRPILPNHFDTVRVRKDDSLVVQFLVPEGGGDSGKTFLRIILMAVVAVASIYTGGLAALGAYAPYAAVGVAMVGGMLVNALVPPTPLSDIGLGHKSSAESDVYSISGMRNYLPNYKALPIVLGRVRYAPPFGANPYTRLDGNDQYLHLDFVWGAGELQIDDIRIGEAPINGYNDLVIKTNTGKDDDKELDLYPSDVDEQNLSIVLKKDVENVQRCVFDSQRVDLDFVFPRGLFRLDDKGDRLASTVRLQVLYRKVGTADWSQGQHIEYAAATQVPLRRNLLVIDGTFPGQYDIKVVRETPDKVETDNKLFDEIVWTTIRSVKYKDPVTFDIPIAETQMVIKATDQLNSVVDTLNGLVTSVCLDYEVSTGRWVKRATNNPASLYRHVYQGHGCAKPMSDAELDIPALEEWHDFCERNDLSYNKVHDAQMSTQQVIMDICHAGRATFVRPDDVHSVVIDQANQYGPVQFFTPENSRNFSSKKIFQQELHGYRVNFNNREADYAEDELTIYNKDYTYLNATLLESLQFSGVDNVAQVAHLTKYHMATREYRSELFTWDAIDWEHIVCSRGDLVRLSHPTILVSIGTGRIRIVDHGIRQIILDQEITFAAGVEYGLSVRTDPTSTSYSEVFTIPVVPAASTTDTLTVTGPLPATITKGTLYGIGKIGFEALDLIVTSKRPTKDMGCRITALQYSWSQIEAYINGEFPDAHTGITAQVFTPRDTPPPPTIIYVNTGPSAAAKLPDGSTLQRIIAMVSIPSGWKVVVATIQAEISTPTGWQRSPSTDPSQAIVFDGVLPGTVEIRVRSVSASGLTSAWVYRTVDQVNGTPPPDPIRSMTVSSNLFVNDLEWVLPVDYRETYLIEIYCTAGINDRASSKRVAKLSGGTIWSHVGLIPGVDYFYWIRVVDSKDTSLVSEFYPLSPTGGIWASPATDPAKILGMLTASISDSQLTNDLLTRIDEDGSGFISKQTLLENEWTVKIQEIDGTPYLTGVGLILYPDWTIGVYYEVGEYVWMESRDEVYRCVSAHTSSISNEPPLPSWVVVPNGKKSQFIIMADQFALVKPDGTGKTVPFVINGNVVGIDGELVVNGTIRSNALSTTDAYAVTLQSQDYIAGVRGYKLNSSNGTAEFNNMVFSFNSLSDKPTSLNDINQIEYNKLNAASTAAYDVAEAKATAATALTAAQVAKGVADSKILPSQAAWAVNNNTTKIDGGKIYVPYLSALVANMGTITAGQINFGGFTGYSWPSYGITGAHFSASGILLGNANNGNYVEITQHGEFYAPGITIANGNATFSGTLAANTVRTDTVVANNITEVTYASAPPGTTYNISGSWQNVAYVWNNKVSRLMVSVAAAGSLAYKLRVLVDDAVVLGEFYTPVGFNGPAPMNFTIPDPVALPGAHYYRLQIAATSNYGQITMSMANITTTSFKR